jgi:hypothetical protein
LKIIVLASVAALVLGYVASFVLASEQEPAYQAYTGSGARVGDPGNNLVGPAWNGMNTPRAPQG